MSTSFRDNNLEELKYCNTIVPNPTSLLKAFQHRLESGNSPTLPRRNVRRESLTSLGLGVSLMC